MIIDSFNEYSCNQAVTDSAASTNVVDTLGGGRIEGKPIFLHLKCKESAAAAGAATVTFAFETSNSSDFSSKDTLWNSAAIGKADLTAGSEIVRLALNGLKLKRYTRVYYTIGTGPLTAGKFSAFLSNDADTNLVD